MLLPAKLAVWTPHRWVVVVTFERSRLILLNEMAIFWLNSASTAWQINIKNPYRPFLRCGWLVLISSRVSTNVPPQLRHFCATTPGDSHPKHVRHLSNPSVWSQQTAERNEEAFYFFKFTSSLDLLRPFSPCFKFIYIKCLYFESDFIEETESLPLKMSGQSVNVDHLFKPVCVLF